MAVSKNFLVDYLLKSLKVGEGHHLVGSSLEVAMDKIHNNLWIQIHSDYQDFVTGSKQFV